MTNNVSYKYERAVPFFEDAEDFCRSLCKLEEAVNAIKGDITEDIAWKIRRLHVEQQRRAEVIKNEIDDIIDNPYQGTYQITYFYPPGEMVFFQGRFPIYDPRWEEVLLPIGKLVDTMGTFSLAAMPLLKEARDIDNYHCQEDIKKAMKATRQEDVQKGFDVALKKYPQIVEPLKPKIDAFLKGREAVLEQAKEVKKTLLDEERSRGRGFAQLSDIINDKINEGSIDPNIELKGQFSKTLRQ